MYRSDPGDITKVTYNVFRRNEFVKYRQQSIISTTDHWVGFLLWQEMTAFQWRHNGRDSVSNHQPHDCLLNRLFRRRSKKTSKLRVTGLFAGNSPVTGEFPAQMTNNAENVSIWRRHHGDITDVGAPSGLSWTSGKL